MRSDTKKLGQMLIEAGLITPDQLRESLRHQQVAGGRLGSTLVAMGFISEDSLMDLLSRKAGVPRVDLKNLDVPLAVLQRIPRRMAEQFSILPVAFKEPKSLVLAMADPMDLNAVDSARFASGLTIEPVVAAHTPLRQAISSQYTRLASGVPVPAPMEVPAANRPPDGLPLPPELAITPFIPAPPPDPEAADALRNHPKDPFFTSEDAPAPFNFFADVPSPEPAEEGALSVIPQRSAMAEHVRALEDYGTRALVLGLIRMLQRRGIVGRDELQRLLNNLIEAREIDPDL